MKHLKNLVSGIALAVLAFAVAALAGCTTEITVNGNNNSVDTSPAKYAGYGGTIDVLKGMSLPGIGLGGQKETASEEVKAALPIVTEEKPKNVEPAVVETPAVSVSEEKVTVNASDK